MQKSGISAARKKLLQGSLVVALFAATWIWCDASGSAGTLYPSDLRCEYLKNPLGIDVLKPRLSWKLQSLMPTARSQKQTAYQILVSSSEQLLQTNRGDLWDSEKVYSDQSIHLEYAGSPLPSHQACFWKVRVWDNQDKVSAWSGLALWTMGLLRTDEWKARWIGLDGGEKSIEPVELTKCSWIGFPGTSAAKGAPGKRFFRRKVMIPEGRKATGHCQRSLGQSPDDPRSNLLMAELLLQQNQMESALPYVRKIALLKGTNDPEFRVSSGVKGNQVQRNKR